MQLSITAVMLVAMAGADLTGGTKTAVYDNYTTAYTAAKQSKKPMLVILNPGTEGECVDLDEVCNTAHRKELLKNYVVVDIDTTTQHGKKVNALFASQALPRVVVIDKAQEWQIYRTSKTMSKEDWNIVLTNYRNGVKPAPVAPVSNCPWCR